MLDDVWRLEEYRRIVQKILEAFNNVPFPIIVEVATNKKVVPIDIHKNEDKFLIRDLATLADIIVLEFNKDPIDKSKYGEIRGKVPKNFRPNEVSIYLEYVFPKIFNENKDKFKVIKNVEHLTKTGYPDEKVTDVYGRTTFIEIKATTRPNEGSPRDFFFTPLENTKDKISDNGRHILLGFVIKEVEPKVFKTVGWKIVDLSKIYVSMKPEFNADNRELYKNDALIAENWVEALK